jgi:hypothetical protein
MYTETIAVCSEIHTKYINTLCGQNVELLNVKSSGTYSNPLAVKGLEGTDSVYVLENTTDQQPCLCLARLCFHTKQDRHLNVCTGRISTDEKRAGVSNSVPSTTTHRKVLCGLAGEGGLLLATPAHKVYEHPVSIIRLRLRRANALTLKMEELDSSERYVIIYQSTQGILQEI